MKAIFIYSVFLTFSILLMNCSGENSSEASNADSEKQAEKWVSIFNGKDLTGWTPKIVGHEAGENWKNTFIVEDGVLKVNYAEYDTFPGSFGHLFYEKPYSRYKMRLEYRFTGDQVNGGAAWAYRNNGIMFHAQSAASMELDQAFPVCLEFQFLGADTTGNARSTGCLCTPGTNVTVNDTLNTTHCIANHGPTIAGDDWVKAELYVDGSKIIHHIINGDTVFTYSNPVIGGGHLPENYVLEEGTIIDQGFIALQSETAPTEFRNIEVMELQ